MPSFRRAWLRIATALAAVVALAVPGQTKAALEPTGEQIFRRRCARCHGVVGEGTPDEFPHPLTGDKTVPVLAAYIAEKMPEDDPGACAGAVPPRSRHTSTRLSTRKGQGAGTGRR